jgi:hypothetical protein
MLRNEAYIGVLIWKKTKDEIVKTENAFPRIISQKIWDLAQKRIGENKELASRRSLSFGHPFAGLAFCEHCGGRMAVDKTVFGKSKITCTNKRNKRGCIKARYIDEEALIAAVKKALIEDVYVPNKMRLAFERWAMEIKADGDKGFDEVKSARKKLREIDKSQELMLFELEKGELPRDAIKKRLDALESQKKAILSRIAMLDEESKKFREVKATPEDLQEFCEMARDQIKNSEGERLRTKLSSLGVRLTIGDEVKIEIAPGVIRRLPTSISAERGKVYVVGFPIPNAYAHKV